MGDPSTFRIEYVTMDEQRLDLSAAGEVHRTVSLVIGANGTGKSTLLGELARAFAAIAAAEKRGSTPREAGAGPRRLSEIGYQADGRRHVASFATGRPTTASTNGEPCSPSALPIPSGVTALTISPFDKFPLMAPSPVGTASARQLRYAYSGARRRGGRAGIMPLLYNALDNLTFNSRTARRRSGVSRVFAFLGYAPHLTFSYRRAGGTQRIWWSKDRETRAAELGRAAEAHQRISTAVGRIGASGSTGLDELLDAVELVRERFDVGQGLRLEAWIDADATSFGEDEVARAAAMLRSSGLLDLAGVEAARSDQPYKRVHLADASSGELSILVNLLSLAATIDDGTLVLIDEPELSLHPKWQSEYVDLLLGAFENYNGCHYVLATHSPLVVGDAPWRGSHVVRLGGSASTLPADRFAGQSPDYLLVNAFGVATEGNYYIRDLLAHALRMTYGGRIASDDFDEVLNELSAIRPLLPAASPVGRTIDELAAARHSLEVKR